MKKKRLPGYPYPLVAQEILWRLIDDSRVFDLLVNVEGNWPEIEKSLRDSVRLAERMMGVVRDA